MAHRLLTALAIAGALAGCARKVTVAHYPAFYDPEIETVAVAPFANESLSRDAADYLTRRFARALESNGTYEVLAPEALKTRIERAGLDWPERGDGEALAAAIERLEDVQAVLAGTVTSFGADRVTGIRRSYVYAGYRFGYPHYHHGYWGGYPIPVSYSYTYSEAYVAARASLLRAGTGERIHQMIEPAAARVRVDGTQEEALSRAATQVAWKLVERFAVTPKEIEIDPGRALRTARRREGRWRHTDDFRAGDRVFVVVRLPPGAARNRFRLAITAARHGGPVAEKRFRWERTDRRRRFGFPAEALVRRAGPGRFDVCLYAKGRLILKRDFEIERP